MDHLSLGFHIPQNLRLDFDKESSKKQGSLFDAIKNGAKALEKADDYGED